MDGYRLVVVEVIRNRPPFDLGRISTLAYIFGRHISRKQHSGASAGYDSILISC